MIVQLAIKSLRNRKFTAALTVLSIALAVLLLLGVERIRQEARESFASTISGTDLIVGARSSPVHLLLYSVFRIGNPTNNLRWDSYRAIVARSDVVWSIPISLGDSHRGYRVLATTKDYFEHFRYARQHRLEFATGEAFGGEHDAVLGADVADSLGYAVGISIVIAHGAGEVSFSLHKEHPFRVTGVLARTGTPVDRTVHITLQGLDAVHGAHIADDPLAAALREKGVHHASGAGKSDVAGEDNAESKRGISAFLLGLTSRGAALSMQRWVNEYSAEPLTAILPGPTLQEVWEIVGTVEKTLIIVSMLVVVVGMMGMLVALLTSLSERRREMAILRSVGARPVHIFGLLLGEAAFLTGCGVALGIATLYVVLLTGGSWLQSKWGLTVTSGWPSMRELGLIMMVGGAGVLVGAVPAYRIYRHSLADGMTIRV
jgi:putative ABC transport system permease protein